MIVSKRKYYCYFLFTMFVAGVLLLIGTPVINHYLFHIEMIDKISKVIAITLGTIIIGSLAIILLKNKGIKNTISKYALISSIEDNLLSIGAYKKVENKNYVILPKIKIKHNTIMIKLKDLRIRVIIERYLDSFSTALPKQYVVEDYYLSENNSEIIIKYENVNTYKPDVYANLNLGHMAH